MSHTAPVVTLSQIVATHSSLPAEAASRSRRPGADVVVFPSAPVSDAALLSGVLERRPAALTELFDRYAPLVRRMLIRTLGTDRDAEDLVQETFLIVIDRAHTLRKVEALKSFVLSVAVRIAKNELRKRIVRRWVGLDTMTVPPLCEPHDAVTAEKVRHVYDALAKMEATSRIAFVLRHVEGLELTELADVVGCSLATVKRKLSRAEKHFEALANADEALRDLVGSNH